MYTKIGKQLRQACLNKGILLSDMYEQLGWHNSTGARKLTGEVRLSIPELMQVCEILDLDVCKILDDAKNA